MKKKEPKKATAFEDRRDKKIKNKRMRQRTFGESCKSIKVVLSSKRKPACPPTGAFDDLKRIRQFTANARPPFVQSGALLDSRPRKCFI